MTGILDIPVHNNRIHALHVLFTLFSEFKNSQVCTESTAVLLYELMSPGAKYFTCITYSLHVNHWYTWGSVTCPAAPEVTKTVCFATKNSDLKFTSNSK